MKIVSTRLEYQALRTICDASDKLRSLVLASLNEDCFFHPPTKAAYEAVMASVRQSGEIPSWTELCSDPKLSEKYRKLLKGSDAETTDSRRDARSMIRTLDKMRRVRGLYSIAEQIYNEIEGDQLDVEKLTEALHTKLVKSQTKVDLTQSLFHTGKGNNSVKLVKDLLSAKKPKVVPTGFDDFDRENGGFLEGSLVVLAADSGGGKSAVANQLGINMARRGHDVAIVPLEMTATQMKARELGVLSGIDVNRISQGRLSNSERKLIKSSYVAFVKELKEIGTRYSILSPDEDVSIEEVLFSLKPYGYKVVIVDYISLLKGADGDEQWKQLTKISRFAKIWAKNTNTVVILVAQLSKEGLVRYSGGIKENANNLWSWTAPAEISDVSILDIEQQKARNQKKFPFQIMAINAPMQYKDVDRNMLPDGGDDDEEDSTSRGKTKRGSGSSSSGRHAGSGKSGFRTTGKSVRPANGRNKHRSNDGRRKDQTDKDEKYLEDLSDVE